MNVTYTSKEGRVLLNRDYAWSVFKRKAPQTTLFTCQIFFPFLRSATTPVSLFDR